MRLRPLEQKDAPLMLEWMQDASVLQYLRMNAGERTLADACAFIAAARDPEKNAHFAVADGDDTYLGTVSLKHIHRPEGEAEFAIALRKTAQGRGIGAFAASAVLEYAFLQRGLSRVYLEVLEGNRAAVASYERVGFRCCGILPSETVHGCTSRMLQYAITADQFDPAWRERFRLPGLDQVQRLTFQQRGDDRGRLVIAECGKEVPFEIRRIFYIYGSEAGVVRGRHANRRSEFVFINVAGSSRVRATDGRVERLYALDHPHEGLYLPRMIWKEMFDFSPDSVLLVLSNECYDPNEYVRDYDAYLEEVHRFG